MKKIKITALKQTVYDDLIEIYENPLENPCSVKVGSVFVSENGQKPNDFCQTAWECMEDYVKTLANGGGNFFDGWMKNPYSAFVSCNDGFRPMSFLIETIEE